MKIINIEIDLQKITAITTLSAFLLSNIFSFDVSADNDRISYPLKEISKLECRFEDFSKLGPDCKQKLPILKTSERKKYLSLNGWYNDFTRIYTVLWGASYKYWWDVWYGWHQWIDIATAKGTPVYSIADWTVILASDQTGWWNAVSIKHTIRGKVVYSNYTHLSKISVSKWDIIKMWEKIWEVWSTWNSTGNHLHFQIDLDTPFHPYYYDTKKCPYSYYEITEWGLCFDELQKNTIDPIKFFETDWKVLDEVEQSNVNISRSNFSDEEVKVEKKVVTTTTKTNSNNWELDIFERTVYKGYSTSDIKEVQKVFKNLWYYNWEIDWNYDNIEKSIIKYQIEQKIISSKDQDWAGRFWPKTRAVVKTDYIKYLASNKDSSKEEIVRYVTPTEENYAVTRSNVTTEKVERVNMLSREEIEAKEVNDFITTHTLDYNLSVIWWNIKVWEKAKLHLSIKNKKWKPFNWSLPASVTFDYDTDKVGVFPVSMYYFTDWYRDIEINWLKSWNTDFKIKMWNTTIKSYALKVYSDDSVVSPKYWEINLAKTSVIWEEKKGLVIFKDWAWKSIINMSFNWTFKLDWWNSVLFCRKNWALKDLEKLKNSSCIDTDYSTILEANYKDTVWGLLLFDYKVLKSWKNTVKLLWKSSWKVYWSIEVTGSEPKWLTKNYEYYNETIKMLKAWVVDWVNSGYFLETRNVTWEDTLSWIENSLQNIIQNSTDKNILPQAKKNLVEVKRDKLMLTKELTRKEFLDKAYKYLVFSKNSVKISINYSDLTKEDNIKANAIFDKNNTWRDQFGNSYFRPNEKITRWEWAYLLSVTLDKWKAVYLTVR